MSENKPAFELASFETPPSGPKNSAPVAWSLQKHQVATLIALSGKAKTEISRETGVPLGAINKWLEHPEFNVYIQDLVLEAAKGFKSQNLMILNKILQARLAEAELQDKYSSLSKADTLEVMAAISKETAAESEKDDTNYAKILRQMFAAQQKTIDITPSDKKGE